MVFLSRFIALIRVVRISTNGMVTGISVTLMFLSFTARMQNSVGHTACRVTQLLVI